MRKLYVLAVGCFFFFACGSRTAPAPYDVPHVLRHPATATYTPFDPNGNAQDLVKPRANAIAVNFGSLVKLKAVYTEQQEPFEVTHQNLPDAHVRRHFGLLASSSVPGTTLTGEGELAYSQFGAFSDDCDCSTRPMMMRLAFKNRWDALHYGGDYRSFEPGFVSITGLRSDLDREEGELWAERAWGALKIRGSVTHIWEKPPDAAAVRLTRTAAAALNYSAARWGGSFASSYSMVQPNLVPDNDTVIANHRIALSYRPVRSLSLAPNLSLTQEWNAETGTRTQSPATGLALVYAPFRDWLQLSSDTSLTRTLSTDGSSDVTTFGTGTALEWKVGKFIGRADRLSLSLNYNRRLDLLPHGHSSSDIRSMLLLQVTGF